MDTPRVSGWLLPSALALCWIRKLDSVGGDTKRKTFIINEMGSLKGSEKFISIYDSNSNRQNLSAVKSAFERVDGSILFRRSFIFEVSHFQALYLKLRVKLLNLTLRI